MKGTNFFLDWLVKANSLFVDEQYAEAIELFQKAIESPSSTTDKVTALVNRAQCYLKLKNNMSNIIQANESHSHRCTPRYNRCFAN